MPSAALNRAQQTTTATLGHYLADLRNAKGMTLRAVEEATKREVSNAYLSQLENGKIQKPSPHILHALAQAYGASYERIMEKAGYIVAVSEAKKAPGGRHGRVAALTIEDFTPEEEELVLKYAAFVRSQRKKP